MNLKSNAAGWLVCALLVLAPAGPGSAQSSPKANKETLAFKAGHIVTGEGKIIVKGTMVVHDGRVVALGQKVSIPAGARVIDFKDGWIVPGMVDLVSRVSMPNDLSEPRDAVDLDNEPAHALVRGHRDFGLLAAEGITAAVVLPDPDGVVSGMAAVVKSDGRARAMARNKAAVALALTKKTRRSDRFPTSLMGSFQLLGQTLAKPQNDILKAVSRGERKALVRVDSEAEIRSWLRLSQTLGVTATLVTDGTVRRVLDELPQGTAVALPAPSLAASRRDLLLPAALHTRKHQLAFFVNTPKRAPADLRYGAALAVKMGLPPQHALHSITLNPALMVGVADRIGSLKAGKDADFLVMSGDVLNLSSVLLQTWIDGHQVYKRSGK